jgi:hypothetical protein
VTVGAQAHVGVTPLPESHKGRYVTIS